MHLRRDRPVSGRFCRAIADSAHGVRSVRRPGGGAGGRARRHRNDSPRHRPTRGRRGTDENDDDLATVTRFLLGRVFPAHDTRTLDVGPALCREAIARAAGPNVTADDVEDRLAEEGEIGAVAAGFEFGGQRGLAAFGEGGTGSPSPRSMRSYAGWRPPPATVASPTSATPCSGCSTGVSLPRRRLSPGSCSARCGSASARGRP